MFSYVLPQRVSPPVTRCARFGRSMRWGRCRATFGGPIRTRDGRRLRPERSVTLWSRYLTYIRRRGQCMVGGFCCKTPRRLFRHSCLKSRRQPQGHQMPKAIVGEMNGTFIDRLAVHLQRRGTVIAAPAHNDFIRARKVTKCDLETGPVIWDDWVQSKHVSAKLESQYRIDPDSVHLSGRARIPRPPASAVFALRGRYVCRHDVGLPPVTRHIFRAARELHGVHHFQQADSGIAVVHPRPSHRHPQGTVRILAPILPDSRWVAHDVARTRG